MKQYRVFLLALLPVALGLALNALLPLAPPSAWWLVSLVPVGIWAWAGARFSRAGVRFLPALLGGNALGILGVAVQCVCYAIWPVGAAPGILEALSGVGGLFVASAVYIIVIPVVSLALLPGMETYRELITTFGQSTSALLMMLLAFALGYWTHRRREAECPR